MQNSCTPSWNGERLEANSLQTGDFAEANGVSEGVLPCEPSDREISHHRGVGGEMSCGFPQRFSFINQRYYVCVCKAGFLSDAVMLWHTQRAKCSLALSSQRGGGEVHPSTSLCLHQCLCHPGFLALFVYFLDVI